MIRLKRHGGFGRPQGYFVQCNQTDCQYVEENKPPCPLHVGLFADEIRRCRRSARSPQRGDGLNPAGARLSPAPGQCLVTS